MHALSTTQILVSRLLHNTHNHTDQTEDGGQINPNFDSLLLLHEKVKVSKVE